MLLRYRLSPADAGSGGSGGSTGEQGSGGSGGSAAGDGGAGAAGAGAGEQGSAGEQGAGGAAGADGTAGGSAAGDGGGGASGAGTGELDAGAVGSTGEQDTTAEVDVEALTGRLTKLEERQAAQTSAMLDALLDQVRVKPAYRSMAKADLGTLDPFSVEGRTKIEQWAAAHVEVCEPLQGQHQTQPMNLEELAKNKPGRFFVRGVDLSAAFAEIDKTFGGISWPQ